MKRFIRPAIALGSVIAAVFSTVALDAPATTTASAQSSGVEVLSASMYVRSDRNTVVVGEVANNSAGTIDRVQITAYLRDQSGEVFEDLTGFVDLSEVPAGGTSPFSVRTYAPLSRAAASFELSVTYDASEPTRVFTFDVTVDSIRQNPRGGMEVVGGVVNTSGVDVSSMTVRVALYDENGTILRTTGTAVRPNLLNAGARGSWNTTFLDAPPSYSTYKVWGEGRPIAR